MLASATAPSLPTWAVWHLQLFTVQRSEELSLPFALTQCVTRQFSPRYRDRYASEVPPSPQLSESGAAPYSDAPTALCGSVPGEHALVSLVRLNCTPDCICFSCDSPIVSAFACCSPIVSASAAAPRVCPLHLLLLDCICLLSCTHSTKYRKLEGCTSLL